MKNILNDDVKEIILNKIFKAEYRAVMKMILDGYSKEEVAYQAGYSVRQVERIRNCCWREVCILLAEEKTEMITPKTLVGV